MKSTDATTTERWDLHLSAAFKYYFNDALITMWCNTGIPPEHLNLLDTGLKNVS